MKIIKIIIVISILGILFSCDPVVEPSEQYPSLKITNLYDGRYIKSVSLVGYGFSNLQILSGDSQTFILDAGMPGGYDNINIQVSYGVTMATWSISDTFDFANGSTTSIALHGSSAVGDPYYNNTCLELY